MKGLTRCEGFPQQHYCDALTRPKTLCQDCQMLKDKYEVRPDLAMDVHYKLDTAMEEATWTS